MMSLNVLEWWLLQWSLYTGRQAGPKGGHSVHYEEVYTFVTTTTRWCT